LARIALAAPLVLFLGVYLPTTGHGFIKDDYRWILESRVGSLDDLVRLFRSDNGFYRPIVALSFAVDEWLFGTEPLGYGLTNVLLALACAAAILSLLRALGLPAAAASVGGALWLLNMHGTRTAVLWVSGRTALLLTFAATMAAAALLRGRLVRAAGWFAVALFAKEEALLVPVVLLVWLLMGRTPPDARRLIWRWIALAGLVVGVYFVARASTNAMTPFDAPPAYRLTFDAGTIAGNLVSYLDRSATLAAAMTLLAVAVLGGKRATFDRNARAAVARGAAWLIGTFGLTIFLPVRSDLYACLPAVGACVMAATVSWRLWEGASPVRRRSALAIVLLLVPCLLPVYIRRTDRWERPASFADAVLADLRGLTASLPDGATVVLQDDRSDPRANLASAFGTLLNDAYLLRNGRRLNLWIEPPLADAVLAGLMPPCATCVDLRLTIAAGRVSPR
jgi:hypothetical protein